jgi:hypothetical protein
VNPLKLRQLKMPLDERIPGAKSSAVNMLSKDDSKASMPNDAKGLTGQVVDLPSNLFIWVVEDGD